MNANKVATEKLESVENTETHMSAENVETPTSADTLPDPADLCRLPVVMFTYDFLKLCIQRELGRIPILLALTLLGNMNVYTGKLHPFKVHAKAKQLKCSKVRVYQALHILREIGFAEIKLRYGTVRGRIRTQSLWGVPKLEQWEARTPENEETWDIGEHAMPVGQLHRIQLQTHIEGTTTAAHLRLMMACCLNMDVYTGKLHAKRPADWAALAGMHRTWVVKGFAHFNEIGVMKTETDYDVTGWQPFVAIANSFLNLTKLEKERGASDARGIQEAKDRVQQHCVILYEAFGIRLHGLAHQIVEVAWRRLGEAADAVLRRIKRQAAPYHTDPREVWYEQRRIVEDAPEGYIPLEAACLPTA